MSVQYFDFDGNERSLDWMVKNEPEWACNIIRHYSDLMEKKYFEGYKSGYLEGSNVTWNALHQTEVSRGIW